MRLLSIVVALVAGSGCHSAVVSRVALVPTPGAPQSLSGATGISPGMRAMLGQATAGEGGGVAHPRWQPELGAVFRTGANTRANLKLVVAPSEWAESPFGVRPAPKGLVTAELGGGAARDFPLDDATGLTVAGEASLALFYVTATDTRAGVMPMARVAAGPYASLGPVRLYGALMLGTDVWSDPYVVVGYGVEPGFGPGIRDRGGRTFPVPLVSAGGGATLRLHRHVGVSAEGWYHLTHLGARLPPMVAVSLHLLELDVSPQSWTQPSGSAPPPPPPSEGG